jgi:hypothetical protein
MSRISVKDAARQLGLSEDSVLRRIRDKRLVGNRDNRGQPLSDPYRNPIGTGHGADTGARPGAEPQGQARAMTPRTWRAQRPCGGYRRGQELSTAPPLPLLSYLKENGIPPEGMADFRSVPRGRG